MKSPPALATRSSALKPEVTTYRGHLFDVYNVEEEIHVWLALEDGRRLHFRDTFYPVIYARGPEALVQKLLERLRELDALRSFRPARRRLFYENQEIDVLEITLSRPRILPRIRRKLYAFYGRMDLYHSDMELPTGYMLDRGIFPLARVELRALPDGRIAGWRCLDDRYDPEYTVPEFRTMSLRLEHSHRLTPGPGNPMLVETATERHTLDHANMADITRRLGELLVASDPDILLTAYGDQAILPALLQAAHRSRITLPLDRDPTPATRRLGTRGNSFMTYGSWIYRAPSIPLFGRWHIDSGNTFVYKEADLAGTIELARLSRMSAQRMARASTGMALTAIEMEVALDMNYLVPWQKSAVEESKTFYQLVRIDKGGMIFAPDTSEGNVYENVAQCDFAQMYPSIMALHNISPETVNCPCCRGDDGPRVPEAGYTLCTRRRGVVSRALERLLDRRRYYKTRLKEELPETQREIYRQRQSSLKWMFVTSFGYLGFRNAKFGRLESHEAVTAFGRDKLLTAREIAEDRGYDVLHAITDCLFLKADRPGALDRAAILDMCAKVGAETGVTLNLDGLYHWVVFLPSRQDPDLPVINRYFGLFDDGELKYRGIAARRKDVPTLIASGQLKLLGIMSRGKSVTELRELHDHMDAFYREVDDQIQSGADWRQLLVRRTVSRPYEDYRVAGGTYVALSQIRERGADAAPGEKVRFVVRDRAHPDPMARYLSEEEAAARYGTRRITYDIEYYRKAWLEAYREVWEYFAPAYYFDRLPPRGQGYLF